MCELCQLGFPTMEDDRVALLVRREDGSRAILKVPSGVHKELMKVIEASIRQQKYKHLRVVK